MENKKAARLAPTPWPGSDTLNVIKYKHFLFLNWHWEKKYKKGKFQKNGKKSNIIQIRTQTHTHTHTHGADTTRHTYDGQKFRNQIEFDQAQIGLSALFLCVWCFLIFFVLWSLFKSNMSLKQTLKKKKKPVTQRMSISSPVPISYF